MATNHKHRPKNKKIQGRGKSYTRPLNPMQLAFIEQYPKAKSNVAAAIAAGYSKKSAAVTATRLLQDPRVIARLDLNAHRRRKYRERTEENILDELAKLGFSNILDFFDGEGIRIPIQDLPRDVAAAVRDLKVTRSVNPDTQEVTEQVDLKLHDKRGALEQLGRNQGLFVDKTEHSGVIGHAFIESLGRTLGPPGHRLRPGQEIGHNPAPDAPEAST